MKKRKRLRVLLILGMLMAVVMFSCGFGVWTVVVNLFEPAGPANSPTVPFIIREGESTAEIADDLQAQHLINSALAFRLWAEFQGLDRKLEAGAYQLSASMTIPVIVDTFLSASPFEIWVTIPEGWRIPQIAQRFSDNTILKEPLTKFQPSDFIQIAQTGTYKDTNGKSINLASEYWFLSHHPQGPEGGAPDTIQCSMPCDGALEGFLFPSTYLVPLDATASDVIKIMLNTFGEQLCPGPSNHPDAYLPSEQQCEAHGAVIDQTNHKTIFDLLQKNYGNTDSQNMADKLYHALTLASIVEREARTHDDRQGIAAVYYKRYQVSTGELTTAPDPGLGLLQADPTLQYWLGTASNPWPQLQEGGNQYDNNPYNTYKNVGLPPGPICAPGLDALIQAINPPNTPYFYFITGKDGMTHYARTLQEQEENINKYGLPS